MPIRISQGLLVGLPGADPALLERDLWARSGGACALCAEPMDPAGEELEAGRDPAGGAGVDGLQLSHARCHHDVVDARDRERLAAAHGDDAAAYLAARGWTRSRRRRVEPRAPLLRCGSGRRWTWLVEGTLPDGSGVQLGGLATSYADEGGEDEEGRFVGPEDGETVWTVVLLDADYPDIGFATLARHDAMDDVMGDDSSRRRVPLESAAFEAAVRLTQAAGGDEQALRARFTPAVQIALASRGILLHDRLEADTGAVLAARMLDWGEDDRPDVPTLIDLLGDAVWLRAVLTGDPPGRVPDREALRALTLGTEAEREGFEPSIEENPQ
ncbi:MAG: hypothetical protein ACKO7U_11305 [Actinomycetota bacterium]